MTVAQQMTRVKDSSHIGGMGPDKRLSKSKHRPILLGIFERGVAAPDLTYLCF